MTTTAHEDQFTAGTQTIQPVLQPYSTEAILRRNIADAEKEMQRQAERAESYAETLRSLASYVGAGGYNADVVDADVFGAKIRWGIDEIMARTEKAEAELARLAQQEPIKYLYRVTDCFGHDVLRDDPRDATIIETIPLYAAPVPAPAVPDWNVNIERIRDVMHMLGISIEESVECFSAALPTNINRMTLAMKRHLQELAGMTAATAP